MKNNSSNIFLKEAELLSGTGFYNSLLREWDGYSVSYHEQLEVDCVVIDLKNNSELVIPLNRFSVLGKHEYRGDYFIRDLAQNVLTRISFSQAVAKTIELLKEDQSKNFRSDSHESSRIQASSTYSLGISSLNAKNFYDRVMASCQNIEQSLQYRLADYENVKKLPFDFTSMEQALLVGHSFHPTPKSRDQFDWNDLIKYTPEFKGEFNLEWFLLHPSVLFEMKADSFKDIAWTTQLFEQVYCKSEDLKSNHLIQNNLEVENSQKIELENVLKKINEGYVPYPVHPWQKQQLLKNKDIAAYLKQGLIIDLLQDYKQEYKDETVWYPTSSVRTIYNKQAKYMLKFSMSVKLTNSIRHMQPVEVERGLQLSDVLHTSWGQGFKQEFANLEIIEEPAAMGIKDKSGHKIIESLVLCRFNPFIGETNNSVAVLASLTQDPLYGSRKTFLQVLVDQWIKHNLNLSGPENPILQNDSLNLPNVSLIKSNTASSDLTAQRTLTQQQAPQQQQAIQQQAIVTWFRKYLAVTVVPLVKLYANYGVVLGAHQQNIVLECDAQGLPTKSYFRDCHGTGYTDVGYALFASSVESIYKENGNVISDEMGHCLFGYYLILNSTFNVISALCRENDIKEENLLAQLADCLKQISQEGVKDASILEYLLKSEWLEHKGNFICSISETNENTIKNPLAIYRKVKNPLKDLLKHSLDYKRSL